MQIEIVSIISATIIGIGGIVASIISAILTSRRAKEANTIAKESLLRTTYIEQKKADLEKVISTISKFLQISSPLVLDSDYKSLSNLSANLSEVIASLNYKKQELFYYSNLIYLEMPVDSDAFLSLVASICHKAIDIYDQLEDIALSINRNMEQLNLSRNDRISDYAEKIIDSALIKSYRESMNAYTDLHAALAKASKDKIECLKEIFLDELKSIEKEKA